jgi:hypothetical protein
MNMYNPYIQQMPQTQDLGGLAPYYQNIANQQAMQQQALQQGMNLTNQAGMTVDGKQAGASMNPMAMAMMLRKGSDPYANAQEAMKKYGAENVYGFGGQGQTPTNANWDLDAQGM